MWNEFIWNLGDGINNFNDSLFHAIGNSFNYLVIVGGFVGLAIWLKMQGKYNKEAANNPDQFK